NPRSREGSDLSCMGWKWRVISVSIHAPAKGATYQKQVKQQTMGVSIHAPAKGATFFLFRYPALIHRSFNPRSREGSDLHSPWTIGIGTGVSIHAPAKGAT